MKKLSMLGVLVVLTALMICATGCKQKTEKMDGGDTNNVAAVVDTPVAK